MTMKRVTFAILFVSMLTLACQNKKTADETTASESQAPVTLTMKWETDTVLTTCESVLFDSANNVIYVSNINGNPEAKDGNGFIAKLSPDGDVSQREWVTGIDAPKGMGLMAGKLYVADIDRVHVINVATGEIEKSYTAEGARFLNDITIDDNGRVYISDTYGNAVYIIENDNISKWMEIDGPNGLLADGDGLLVLQWNSKTLNTLNPESKEITSRTDGIENPDGVEALEEGGYLVSSWNGIIHHVADDWKRTVLLDTRGDSISSADIEYIQSKKLLLVPTFFNNKVVAYEVSK